VIVIAGVALRVVYLFVVARDTQGYGDWHYFHLQGILIAQGHGFTDPWAWLQGRQAPSATHPPLYSLLIGGVSKLGVTSYLGHRVPGIFLGGVTIALIGVLGRRVRGATVGLLAAGLAAVYPTLIAADGALLSETLYGPLIALSLIAGYRMYDRPDWLSAGLAGAAVGLAALTRSEAILLVPLMIIPVALRASPDWRTRILSILVGGVAFALVISPWVIRNIEVFGQPVLSTNEAAVIAGSNCQRAYQGNDIGSWVFGCIPPISSYNEAVQGDIWREQGLAYVRSHLSDLPVVVVARLGRVLDLYQPRRMVLWAEGRQIRFVQAGIAMWWLMLPFAAFGFVLLWRCKQPVAILLAPWLTVATTTILGYGAPRLRHSVEISVVVLAAVAIVGLRTRWRSHTKPSAPPAVPAEET
jgi:4-amino-4-deoxy-L-arabinose transferase-like glycosyltransferase